MASTQPARGMRDFLPSDVRKRDYVIGVIKQVYESYGFEPLETPAVENIDTLMGKYGDEGNQLIFKILKRGEKLVQSASFSLSEREDSTPLGDLADLALRYDLTVPLARVVANNRNDLPKFFKRYQIQPVWRADRPAKGRFREFYQCDVDAIGSESMIVEAELISAVGEIMRHLGFNDFTIRVNSRKLLTEILDAAGVPGEKHIEALVALDKLDKVGREGVAKEFVNRGIGDESSQKLLIFFESLVETDLKDVVGRPAVRRLIDLRKRILEKEDLFWKDKEKVSSLREAALRVMVELEKLVENEALPESHTKEIRKSTEFIVEATKRQVERVRTLANLYKLQTLRNFVSEDPEFNSRGIDELLRLVKLIDRDSFISHEATDYSRQSANAPVILDPTLARGLSYYTGTIMEINVPDLAGSLGGGGRYDGLIGMFGKEQIPACGFSLGLERILVVMDERGMFPPEIAESAPADVLVTIWSDDTAAESLKLAQELRTSAVRVTLYPEADKLGKQIKYADSIKVPFVCVLGESEIADGTVTIKNMTTGDQTTVERRVAAATLAAERR